MAFPLSTFLRSTSIGFLATIPLGPVAIITMKRTAQNGIRAGIISILPVITLDMTVVILILAGLSRLFTPLAHLPQWIVIIGALFLFGYGTRLLLTPVAPVTNRPLPWQKNFLTSLTISLANPSTYISFAGFGLLLSRFRAVPEVVRLSAGIGFCLGMLLWWSTLIALACTQREHYKKILMIGRVVGLVIMVMAVVLVFPMSHILHYFRFLPLPL